MSSINIRIVKNGFIIDDDSMREFRGASSKEMMVALNPTDLSKIVRDWAKNKEKGRDGQAE